MPDVFYDYCDQLARWMAHSGPSLIGAGPTPKEEASNVPLTARGDIWYLHVLPAHQGPILLRDMREPKAITLLRTGTPLSSSRQTEGLAITIPIGLRTDLDDVVAIRWNDGSVGNR